jgi:CBS domain containing-hemolysin-like protein
MSVTGLAGIVLLLAVNGYFVAAEFALISSRRTRLERDSSRRARTVLAAMASLPAMLAGAQLGVTVASLALGALGEPTLAAGLRPVFHAVRIPEDLLHPVSFALALTIVVTGHILIGEMVPKNLALTSPERTARWLVPPLYVFARALRPLLTAITATANLALRLFGIPPASHVRTVYTADELPALIGESREYNLLDQPEHDLMIAALGLRDRPVSSVVVPLGEVVTVPPATTTADLQRYAGEHGHSRFPIRTGAALSGYLHILDALGGPAGEPLPPRPLITLPGGTTLADTLSAMRTGRFQLAAITDQAGAVVGVVTLTDVLTGLLGKD